MILNISLNSTLDSSETKFLNVREQQLVKIHNSLNISHSARNLGDESVTLTLSDQISAVSKSYCSNIKDNRTNIFIRYDTPYCLIGLPHLSLCILANYPPPGRGTGYCFPAISLFVSLFLCFFVSLSATVRENGWTDLHEIFREGVEWPWDDLITLWVNSGKRVGGSKVNLFVIKITASGIGHLVCTRLVAALFVHGGW